MNIKAARQILGNAIGMAPKDKVGIKIFYLHLLHQEKHLRNECFMSAFTNIFLIFDRFSRNTSRLNYNWAISAGVEPSMRSILSGPLQIATPGASMQSWKDLLVRQSVLVQYLNLQLLNLL